MILKRFYDEKLAQASFLVGCNATGEAVVIDPNRDTVQYIAAAKAENMRITAVTETHIHADFLSGARELAAAAGATLYLSGEGGPDWLYRCAAEKNVKVVRNGDAIRIGNVRLDVMHTPGHTPEHICFLLTDEPASREMQGAFTGDFIFAGDVGRPDLLERAAGIAGTMEVGARQLYASLKKFNTLPERLLLWPGHGSGSACGKVLGGMPVTTIGYERIANWAFGVKDEKEFVTRVLEDQPDPPAYFAQMKKLNREGPPALGGFRTPAKLAARGIFAAAEETLLDLRSTAQFAAGFIPGAVNVPEGKSFITWAGNVITYSRPIHLLADSEQLAALAARDLAMIGLDSVAGWFGPDALDAWKQKHGALAAITQLATRDLAAAQKSGRSLLDVRNANEWHVGHIPGAAHHPLNRFTLSADSLDRNKSYAVQCQGGTRSQIALSIMVKMGFKDVVNLTGGFGEYAKNNLPVEK